MYFMTEKIEAVEGLATCGQYGMCGDPQAVKRFCGLGINELDAFLQRSSWPGNSFEAALKCIEGKKDLTNARARLLDVLTAVLKAEASPVDKGEVEPEEVGEQPKAVNGKSVESEGGAVKRPVVGKPQ